VKAVVAIAKHVSNADIDLPFELLSHMRRADDFIRLAVLSAFQAFDQRIEIPWESPERCGLILGTSFGPMQTNFDVLDLIVKGEQTSPTLFSHSVFNAAAGYLSRIFNLRGSALTLTDFAYPFFQALQQGCLAITSGQLERCLVLQVETYSELLQDARVRIYHKEAAGWPAGSVCWLLEREGICTSGGCIVDLLTIEGEAVEGGAYLGCDGLLTQNGQNIPMSDPLGAAVALTGIINKRENASCYDCRLTSSYGAVELSLRIQKSATGLYRDTAGE